MKYFTALLLLMISCQTKDLSFQELIKQGDDNYDQKHYLESAQQYDLAFTLQEGTAGQYYNAACSWALTGDTLHSIQYLNLAANKGWKNLKHIKTDKDLLSLHGVAGWKRALKKIQSNVDKYEKNFDKPLKTQLENILVRDQMLRRLYPDAQDKFGKDSDEMKYYWHLMAKEDSLNEIEIVQILKTRGWVGKSVVGGNANTALWLVIQHAPLDVQETWLPLLRESVKKGESGGKHLALLEDRIRMRRGKPQIYGSQIVRDPKTGKQIVYEVFEPEYVNQRRSEVGLGPIEDYVKRFGITWTINQKEK